MSSPEQPAWDGDGVDPFLPARLAHSAQTVADEQAVRDAYFAKLAAWLVLAQRSVTTSGVIPDPNAVFAQAPLWAAQMAEFADTTLREVMARPYETMLGEGFDFDSRPFVQRFLTESVNQLVRVPDEVYDRIASQVAEGALAGDSIPDIRDRVQKAFDVTATPHWSNRATVVARTETLRALNAGRWDASVAVAESLGGQWEKIWIATTVGPAALRTRPTHLQADGQRVPLTQPFIVGDFPLMFPCDPAGPPWETIECRCAPALVRPGETVDLSDRQLVNF